MATVKKVVRDFMSRVSAYDWCHVSYNPLHTILDAANNYNPLPNPTVPAVSSGTLSSLKQIGCLSSRAPAVSALGCIEIGFAWRRSL